MVQEIGLTAKIKPETDTRTAKKEAGKLRGIFEDEMEKMDVAESLGMSSVDPDLDSLKDRLDEIFKDQDISVDDVDMGGMSMAGLLGMAMGGGGGGGGSSDDTPSDSEDGSSGGGGMRDKLSDATGDGFMGSFTEGFLSPKAGIFDTFTQMFTEETGGIGGTNLGDAPEDTSQEALDERVRKEKERQEEGGGGLGSKLGSSGGKVASTLFIGGLALDALMSMKEQLSALANSSPLLGHVMDMFGLALSLFFRPFGNFLGKMLYPAMEALLDLSVQFNKVYSKSGLYGAITMAAREGGRLTGQLVRESIFKGIPWLIKGIVKGIGLVIMAGFEFAIGYIEGVIRQPMQQLSTLEKIAAVLGTIAGGILGGALGMALGPAGAAAGAAVGSELLGNAAVQFTQIMGWMMDMGTGFRKVTDPILALGEATGTVAGFLAGGFMGAIKGAAAGAFLGLPGMIAGAIIGGIGGALLGAGLGKVIGETFDTIVGGIADNIPSIDWGSFIPSFDSWLGMIIPEFPKWIQNSPGIIPQFPGWDEIMDAVGGVLNFGGDGAIEGILDVLKTALAVFFRPFSPLADIFKMMFIYIFGVWNYFVKGGFIEDVKEGMAGLFDFDGAGSIEISGADILGWFQDNLSLAGVVNAIEAAMPDVDLKSIIKSKLPTISDFKGLVNAKIKSLSDFKSVVKSKIPKLSGFKGIVNTKIPKLDSLKSIVSGKFPRITGMASAIGTKISQIDLTGVIAKKIQPIKTNLGNDLAKIIDALPGGGAAGKAAGPLRGALAGMSAKNLAKGLVKAGFGIKGGIGGALKGALKGGAKGAGLGVLMGMPGGGAALGGAGGAAKGGVKGAKAGMQEAQDLFKSLGKLADRVKNIADKLKGIGKGLKGMGDDLLGKGGGLMKGLKGKIPGLGKGGKAAGALSKMGGAAKGVGKGLAKRVPGLGTLMYGAEGAMAAHDVATGKTKDDAAAGKKMGSVAGGAVGGTAGAIAGGAIGSLAGPVGTAIGAAVGGIAGDIIGRKIGGFLGKHLGPVIGDIGAKFGKIDFEGFIPDLKSKDILKNLGFKKIGKDIEKDAQEVMTAASEWASGVGDKADEWTEEAGDFADDVGDKAGEWGDAAGDFASDVVTKAGSWSTAASGYTTDVINEASGWTTAASGFTTDVVTKSGEWATAAQNYIGDIKTKASGWATAAQNFIGDIGTKASGWSTAAQNFIGDVRTKAGSWAGSVQSFIGDIGTKASGWASSVGSFITKIGTKSGSWGTAIGNFVSKIGTKASGWGSAVGDFISKISDKVPSIGSVLSSLKGELDLDLPNPSKALNDVIDQFKNFDLPDIDTGKLKDWLGLATGGIVSSPTPAVVGEGGETEAVMPLSNMASMLNTAAGDNVYSSSDAEGMALKHLPNPKMLEEGGVVTGPTLSMVGEGSETEAVMPLSKLENFLSEKSAPTAEAPDVNVSINGAEIGKTIGEIVSRKIESTLTSAIAGQDGDEVNTQKLETLLEEMLSEMQRNRGDVNVNVDGKTLSKENRKAMDKYDTSREVTQ